jgi:hypothetical protein
MSIRNPLTSQTFEQLIPASGKPYWLESLDLCFLLIICKLGLHVVHCHPSIRLFEKSVAFLRHSLVCAVPSLEEYRCRPVVGEVICGLAGRACGELGWIHDLWTHVWHKRVAANDLVQVCRRRVPRFHQRVETVDDELRASESNQRMAGRDERKRGERAPEHHEGFHEADSERVDLSGQQFTGFD